MNTEKKLTVAPNAFYKIYRGKVILSDTVLNNKNFTSIFNIPDCTYLFDLNASTNKNYKLIKFDTNVLNKLIKDGNLSIKAHHIESLSFDIRKSPSIYVDDWLDSIKSENVSLENKYGKITFSYWNSDRLPDEKNKFKKLTISAQSVTCKVINNNLVEEISISQPDVDFTQPVNYQQNLPIVDLQNLPNLKKLDISNIRAIDAQNTITNIRLVGIPQNCLITFNPKTKIDTNIANPKSSIILRMFDDNSQSLFENFSFSFEDVFKCKSPITIPFVEFKNKIVDYLNQQIISKLNNIKLIPYAKTNTNKLNLKFSKQNFNDLVVPVDGLHHTGYTSHYCLPPLDQTTTNIIKTCNQTPTNLIFNFSNIKDQKIIHFGDLNSLITIPNISKPYAITANMDYKTDTTTLYVENPNNITANKIDIASPLRISTVIINPKDQDTSNCKLKHVDLACKESIHVDFQNISTIETIKLSSFAPHNQNHISINNLPNLKLLDLSEMLDCALSAIQTNISNIPDDCVIKLNPKASVVFEESEDTFLDSTLKDSFAPYFYKSNRISPQSQRKIINLSEILNIPSTTTPIVVPYKTLKNEIHNWGKKYINKCILKNKETENRFLDLTPMTETTIKKGKHI